MEGRLSLRTMWHTSPSRLLLPTPVADLATAFGQHVQALLLNAVFRDEPEDIHLLHLSNMMSAVHEFQIGLAISVEW